MKNETRRMHYVPKTYLKKFSKAIKEPYQLAGISKLKWRDDNIKLIGIENVCVEKDAYMLSGDTVKERQFIETFYNENYEQHYNDIYHLLVNTRKDKITLKERELIISTVVTMFYRTVYWRNVKNSAFNRLLSHAYHFTLSQKQEGFKMGNTYISIEGKTLQEVQSEFASRHDEAGKVTQFNIALRLIRLRLSKDKIVVMKISHDTDRFITSDNPVLYTNIETDDPIPFDESNILYLPLDSLHMLALSPDNEFQGSIVRLDLTEDISNTVMGFNYRQLQSAIRFVLGELSPMQHFVQTLRNNS